jgi:hypothetical protein
MDADGLHIPFHKGFVLAGDGIEIAVLALGLTEGDVDIYAQRGFGFSLKQRHD